MGPALAAMGGARPCRFVGEGALVRQRPGRDGETVAVQSRVARLRARCGRQRGSRGWLAGGAGVLESTYELVRECQGMGWTGCTPPRKSEISSIAHAFGLQRAGGSEDALRPTNGRKLERYGDTRSQCCGRRALCRLDRGSDDRRARTSSWVSTLRSPSRALAQA
mgnify:CR=1 FL=1